MNVFFPGLGFAFGMDFLLLIIFGIFSVSLIGLGILTIFDNPYLTGIYWTAGISLHLGAIYFSTKRKPEKTSIVFAISYFIASLGYLAYCFINFFIRLVEVFNINV